MIGEGMIGKKRAVEQRQMLLTLERDTELSRIKSPKDVQQFVQDVKSRLRQETSEEVQKTVDSTGYVPTVLRGLRDISILVVAAHFGLPFVDEIVKSSWLPALTDVFDTTNTVLAIGVGLGVALFNAKRNLGNAEKKLHDIGETLESKEGRLKTMVTKEERSIRRRVSELAHMIITVHG
jgi:hypothetical protein